MYRYKILIVDDDRLLQNSLRNILSEKYDALVAGSGEECIRILEKNPVDLVLLDIRLPGIDGIETLRLIRETDENTQVIMMTAYEDIKTVITAMKMGAHDYLVKPIDIDEFEIIIEKALENLKLKKEVEELRKKYLKQFDIDNMVSESEGIKRALDLANIIAKSYDTTVLIEGETGTGKEIIANAIHYRSARFSKPFISINCGAINKDLVETELFGYERGTFTGGLLEGKKGKFELADEGTLLLDEISELLPSAQVKLLRVLEEKAFYPVGGTKMKAVDVRVVASTNKSLEKAIEENNFRQDLYYRLNVAKIFLPPLREREDDIIPLVLFYMNKFNVSFSKNFQGISEEVRNILITYPWPGNVRELKNAIERVILMEDDRSIQPDHLSFLTNQHRIPSQDIGFEAKIPPSGINLEELNNKFIKEALELSGGNKTKAAKILGISRPTIVYRIDKFGIKM